MAVGLEGVGDTRDGIVTEDEGVTWLLARRRFLPLLIGVAAVHEPASAVSWMETRRLPSIDNAVEPYMRGWTGRRSRVDRRGDGVVVVVEASMVSCGWFDCVVGLSDFGLYRRIERLPEKNRMTRTFHVSMESKGLEPAVFNYILQIFP